MDFFRRNKAFIIIVLATCLIIGGGIALMSGGNKSTSGNIVNSSILIPNYSYKTSGFENNAYLPASSSANVTLVEFGDYECPACGVYSPFIKNILAKFPGKITYTFRNYPLPQHTNAPISSYAVEAAGIQGKYWEMHEKMFATQKDWSNITDPVNTFIGYANELGLNTDQFTNDINSQKVKDIVKKDTEDGNTVGLRETPTFYINGQKVVLNGNPTQLEELIQKELSK